MTLAFLTLEDRTGFVIDDALAIAELARRGVIVEEVPWRRPGIDWGAYAGVVIRTPWDYQYDLDRFLAVLEAIERCDVPLANPSNFVRWNARKTYLRDLAGRGVAIVPTHFGQDLTAAELRALPHALGAAEVVIKPIVSANADDTYRVTAALPDDQASHVAARFRGRDWMAQPFVTSVLTEGEHSLFYFGGRLSHAITKRPKSGDFRVQEEHGGIIDPLEPDATLRDTGERVIRALGEAPLQARVDLVRLDDGSLALMELEAIEPSLYFRMHEQAPARFADAVQHWLATK
jgi:glutathione synthase/RimK-type ligase-like ATP-grasp enzyme